MKKRADSELSISSKLGRQEKGGSGKNLAVREKSVGIKKGTSRKFGKAGVGMEARNWVGWF